MDRLIMTASSISVSELKANRKYLSVSMRMFSTRPNLNKCAVTEGFIDEIIANKGDYVCMGLFGDTKKLKSNDYKRGLTHMYDRKSGRFLAEQIGAFYDFEKVEDEYGISLIGYARISKRSEAVCEAIERLYEEDSLNFSFEISAGAVEIIDGITIVDANPENELTGMAVVSVPAYPESKALDLVAEDENIDKMFSNALIVSEIDIETVKFRFYDWVCKNLDCCTRVLMFCVDCAILYDEMCGKTYKVEYMFEDDEMIIKDFYEIDFVRSEEGVEMNTDMIEQMTTEAEQVAEVEVAEVSVAEATITENAEEVIAEQVEEAAEEVVAEAEESVEEIVAEETVAEEVQVAEEAEEVVEEEVVKEPVEDEEMAEMRKHCAELEAELEELRALKAQFEQAEAERVAAEAAAQLKTEQDSARAFAQKQGLDVNDQKIAEIIDKCDYKALVAEVNAIPVKAEKKNDTFAFAGYAEMNPKGSYAYLYDRA